MTLPSIVIVLLGSGPVGCCFLFWKRRNAILAGGIAGLRLLRLLFAVLFLWKLWRCNPFRSALCELNAEFIGNVIDCPLWRVSLFACKVRTVPSVHCGRILREKQGSDIHPQRTHTRTQCYQGSGRSSMGANPAQQLLRVAANL